ncbi:endogenous retrovirus group 3 member 1 Env polyprotein-like [Pantherophis guttatus]|uniref:Endogenous retrovirus group 3 member 1 Env polyprotein-like n=1 Tax=Pantherophis guttatus TaxID=94885 RepID=A0ABM3ZLS5_PANGU|nr:endogenous retrovirus group 3 member 1 Env polyprotein-like [Pantherophis guttatus]
MAPVPGFVLSVLLIYAHGLWIHALPKPNPCSSCISITRTDAREGRTLLYKNRYYCKGEVTTNCLFQNITYSACTENSKATCYDPQQPAVYHLLEARKGNTNGEFITNTRLVSKNSPASLVFDACRFTQWPTQCGTLNWQRYYIHQDKYICPQKWPRQYKGKNECNAPDERYCPYWSCIAWATWQTVSKQSSAVLKIVSVKSDCSKGSCNLLNFTIFNPEHFISQWGPQFGIRICGSGKDPGTLIYLRLLTMSETGHDLQQYFFRDFWEETKTPVDIPPVAVNTFQTLVETIAEVLNVTNCYICGGTNMGEQWPWLPSEWNMSIPFNLTAFNVTSPLKPPYSRWPLKSALVAEWCLQRENNSSPSLGHTVCQSTLRLNATGSQVWPANAMPPNASHWIPLWNQSLNYGFPDPRIAPAGLYWICGKTAYSVLDPYWSGSCTLGTIRPSFFMLPLDSGQFLAHTVYNRKKRSLYEIGYDVSQIKIGNWKDDEWPPERIIHYYDPASWAADGTYGYRTPIYMLNRIIRLQAVLELITNETARAFRQIGKTQRQLRNAVFQNRLALDYLLLAEGGVCGKFNLSNCCLEIDDSHKVLTEVADKITKLAHVPVQTWTGILDTGGFLGGLFRNWKQAALMLGVILLGLLMLPCLIPLLRSLIQSIVDSTISKNNALLLEHKEQRTSLLGCDSAEPPDEGDAVSLAASVSTEKHICMAFPSDEEEEESSVP